MLYHQGASLSDRALLSCHGTQTMDNSRIWYLPGLSTPVLSTPVLSTPVLSIGILSTAVSSTAVLSTQFF